MIDEAAQALEASCWIPILKGKRLLLAGGMIHQRLNETVLHTMWVPFISWKIEPTPKVLQKTDKRTQRVCYNCGNSPNPSKISPDIKLSLSQITVNYHLPYTV